MLLHIDRGGVSCHPELTRLWFCCSLVPRAMLFITVTESCTWLFKFKVAEVKSNLKCFKC